MANGRVITGFSKPYVATYTAEGGTVSYTGVTPLARGVNVDVSPESSDDNIFYADNQAAERDAGTFTGGTVTLNVDGLKTAAANIAMGVKNNKTVAVGEENVTVEVYDDDLTAPYVGIGFVVRYMEDGVESFDAVVLNKCRFDQEQLSAATQEENIDFQTQELTAAIMRDDSTKHEWKQRAWELATEALAESVVLALLGSAA